MQENAKKPNAPKAQVKININGKIVLADNNQTILQACEKVGLYIPRFCYNEALSIAGNCRMCLIEIDKSPKLMPACAIKIANDMKIYTKTNLVKKTRENILEFLLINHPLDCRAPFNYYLRCGDEKPTSKVPSKPPLTKRETGYAVKQHTHPSSGQRTGDNSLYVKGGTRARPGYHVQEENNEPDLL